MKRLDSPNRDLASSGLARSDAGSQALCGPANEPFDAGFVPAGDMQRDATSGMYGNQGSNLASKLVGPQPTVRIALIGALGKQATEYAQILETRGYEIVARVDPGFPQSDADRGLYRTLDELLQAADFDAALVSVPHSEHAKIVQRLIVAGKHVIKEKPFATSYHDALVIHDLAQHFGVRVEVIVPRRMWSCYRFAKANLGRIGRVYHVKSHYNLGLGVKTSGWRASRCTSGGGIVLDMGYHLVDVMTFLFGVPDAAFARFAFKSTETAAEDLEDVATICLDYVAAGLTSVVSLMRNAPEKDEAVHIFGDRGTIIATPKTAQVLDETGRVVAVFEETLDKQGINSLIFDEFGAAVRANARDEDLAEHLGNMAVIEALYRSHREQRVVRIERILEVVP